MSENQKNVAAEETQEQDINILKKIRIEKLDELKSKNENPYEITKYDVTAKNADLKAQYEIDEKRITEEANGDEEKLNEGLEKLKGNIVRIAGRIMSWRDMGRANFIDVRDNTDLRSFQRYRQGRIQGIQEVGYRRYSRRRGLCFQNQKGRNLYTCTENSAAFQVASSAA